MARCGPTFCSSWPKGISAKGELRRTPGHVIDFVPTVLDVLGLPRESRGPGANPPPLPGRSLLPAFAQDVAVPRDFLYFHHENNRALRIGDWKLVSKRPNTNDYSLYDLRCDRLEQVNLAGQETNRVAEMARRWQEIEAAHRQQAGPLPPPARANRPSPRNVLLEAESKR